jgi:hydrogenase-4 component B
MALFAIGLSLLLVAGAVAAVGRSAGADRAYAALSVTGCLVAGASPVVVLLGGAAPVVRFGSHLPGGDWVIAIDPLSAVFVLAILGVGGASAVFGVQYLAGHRTNARQGLRVGVSHCLFAVLVVALALVVTAQAVMPFLCAWEVMALTAYLLIVFEDEHAEVRRAGLLYLVSTHTGTLALFGMFAVWTAASADWTFETLAAVAPALGNSTAVVLVLGLVGFGIKAGLVPVHFWLPPAHAAAPSHVSALMSGVVIKVGIYGLLRIAFLMGRSIPAMWGWVVLSIGIVSAVLGVLWALAQHDLKRLLAYHSVENIGIILMGAGMGALGTAYGHVELAVIGYAGAVMHTVNHALFKSLLFLGAGAVYRLTGTRDMERLGGVVRRMPATWLAFLVGSVAIIGVPPLNGFVSEWVVYQSFFRAGTESGAIRLAVLGAAALALVGGLALACFAKVGGVVFLGRARDDGSTPSGDAPRMMLAPMMVLTVVCVAIGIAPRLLLDLALTVAASLGGASSTDGPVVRQITTGATWIGYLAVAIVALGITLWLVRLALLRGRSVVDGETWSCGFAATTPRMQYTASSFAAPLLEAYAPLSGVRTHAEGSRFETHPVDLVLDGLVRPTWTWVRTTASRARMIQLGRLHVYVLYIIVTLLAVLTYLGVTVRS